MLNQNIELSESEVEVISSTCSSGDALDENVFQKKKSLTKHFKELILGSRF